MGSEVIPKHEAGSPVTEKCDFIARVDKGRVPRDCQPAVAQ